MNHLGLIKLGNFDCSQKLPDLTTWPEFDESRLMIARKRITGISENGGIGYFASSTSVDLEKESLSVAIVVNYFRKKSSSIKPLVIPVDDFYLYHLENTSLVVKTKKFNDVIKNSGKDYVIILSGFSQSIIFSQSTLEDIPSQYEAQVYGSKLNNFGNKLMKFSDAMNRMFLEKKSIDNVLNHVSKEGAHTNDAKLLLATSLLLQDCQKWQSLWYEGEEKGTSLYIVAPASFHDAMNRLNIFWGHSLGDYNYRASCSLGNNNEPLFCENYQSTNYTKQGLSSKEFKLRVEHLL